MSLFDACLTNVSEKPESNAIRTPSEEVSKSEQVPMPMASRTTTRPMEEERRKEILKKSKNGVSVPGLQESFGLEDDETDSEVSSLIAEQETDEKEIAPQMDLEAEKYLSKREMTPLQEKLNGLTTLPAGIYCAIFCLTGSWLGQSLIQQAHKDAASGTDFQGEGCLSSSWFPNLHAMPPLPVIAGAMSMILHMPFSFIYHFVYAHTMSQAARIDHWSRRMDQTMLHVYSSLLSYAFSGRMDFFLVNLIFNVDSAYLQWEKKIVPLRNQTRLILSIFSFTLPILERGDYSYFCQIWGTMGTAFAVFALYPFGGWSHTVFHLIFLTVPPMMMKYIPTLPASQDQLHLAAQCAVWAQSQTDVGEQCLQ